MKDERPGTQPVRLPFGAPKLYPNLIFGEISPAKSGTAH
jgi:hypothetical protein